jgi:hypothetical protein
VGLAVWLLFGTEKSLPLLGTEFQFLGHASCSLVPVPTELSQLIVLYDLDQSHVHHRGH